MRKFLLKAAGAFTLVSLLAVGAHITPTAAPAMNKEALTYFYAQAYQGGMNVDATHTGPESASAVMDPYAPTIASGDFHSLGEIYVEGTPGNGVEIGWQVGTPCPGTAPHLFVGQWIAGNFQGYGTNCTGSANWVDLSTNTDNAGKDLTSVIGVATTANQFGMQHYMGAWWLAYGTQYIGHFDDSTWTSGGGTPFATANLVQVFGEVAANVSMPHTGMGKSVLASATSGACPCTGARISSMTYTGGTNAPAVNLVHATDANPTKYNSVVLASNRTMYYGGPGW